MELVNVDRRLYDCILVVITLNLVIILDVLFYLLYMYVCECVFNSLLIWENLGENFNICIFLMRDLDFVFKE